MSCSFIPVLTAQSPWVPIYFYKPYSVTFSLVYELFIAYLNEWLIFITFNQMIYLPIFQLTSSFVILFTSLQTLTFVYWFYPHVMLPHSDFGSVPGKINYSLDWNKFSPSNLSHSVSKNTWLLILVPKAATSSSPTIISCPPSSQVLLSTKNSVICFTEGIETMRHKLYWINNHCKNCCSCNQCITTLHFSFSP